MSEGKRKIFIIIVLLLVIVFGVGQFFSYSNLNNNAVNQQAGQNSSSATGNSAQSQPTNVLTYLPPTPASSTPVKSGLCFAGSIAAPFRSDAYRCAVGNMLADPCFVIPGTDTSGAKLPHLFCGANPAKLTATSTFVLTLTKSLPKQEVPSSTPSNWAWLIELGDGTICAPFTGTRPFTATGEVAEYGCNNAAGGEGMILGDLNNANPTWTAEVGVFSTPTSTLPVLLSSTTVPVATVWQ